MKAPIETDLRVWADRHEPLTLKVSVWGDDAALTLPMGTLIEEYIELVDSMEEDPVGSLLSAESSLAEALANVRVARERIEKEIEEEEDEYGTQPE